MTNMKDSFECKNCKHVVTGEDIGWAEAKDPAPEVNQMATMPAPPDVEPVEKSAEETEYIDVGLGYALGDCDECGGSSWHRISLGILEKDDPEGEKKPPSEDEEPVSTGGVTGSPQTVPLGPEDHAPLIPPESDPQTSEDKSPKHTHDTSGEPKDTYMCEKCGDKIELELGLKAELPTCSICGFEGWQKESF